jgi:DNA modification methylase
VSKVRESLFEGYDSPSGATETSGEHFIDPGFGANKVLPVHRWVPWIAGYSTAFVEQCLSRYLRTDHATVLDPFAGVGTTLLTALLQGHDAVGFEINPYAALASKVKCSVLSIDVEKLKKAATDYMAFCRSSVDRQRVPSSRPPEGFRSRAPFFSPIVLEKVLLTLDYIKSLNDKLMQDYFRLAFGSIMVAFSNYSYEPSLTRRVSVGREEILDYPVYDAMGKKLLQMAKDAGACQKNQGVFSSEPSFRVINSSFFSWSEYMDAESVDLILTSPPYMNNYHYIRNTRPQLYWLGFAEHPSDLKSLEQSNFGKYWQTVRDAAVLELTFSLPDSDLAERLDILRACSHEKGHYGGTGWANYATSYFNDCACLASEMAKVMRPGATAIVVLGNSILQGIEFRTDRYFAEIAEASGLRCVSVTTPRIKRVGSSIVGSSVRSLTSQENQRSGLYEAVVELRRDV